MWQGCHGGVSLPVPPPFELLKRVLDRGIIGTPYYAIFRPGGRGGHRAWKHQVDPEEVEEVLSNQPKIRFAQKGARKGEDVYMALGQTDAGRYLAVLFIYKKTKEALIISARDMADKERKQYGKK